MPRSKATRQTSPKRRPKKQPTPQPLVFEVAWEICQQLGGIYTVMRSKVPAMNRMLGDRYFMVGPWNPKSSSVEYEALEPDPLLMPVLEALEEAGLTIHYGQWLVTGRPRCILIDLAISPAELQKIKHRFWEQFGISLPTDQPLLDETLVFGYRAFRFFQELVTHTGTLPVIGHFHEWMASTAIPDITRAKLPMATVFTTHATMLGRHLAIHDPWFYRHLKSTDWRAEAQRFGIQPQVEIERQAAAACTVFSTVSEVTGQECEHLLARKPDVILPNGLNIERYAAIHEFQNLHRINKEQIHQFVMGHFFPSYSFDLSKTTYFFTAGRYEYHNKGFDLTLEALSRLNWRLKAAKSDRTVVFFLITRRGFHSINPDVLNNRAMMEEMRNTCEQIKNQLGERLFYTVARQDMPDLDDLVDERWLLRLRQFIHAWKTDRLPSIVTHNMHDDVHDEVLNQLRATDLINREEDRVKVVYHPDFVSPSSPLFGMDYPQFVRGCHLGIFPSCYEPWGYTPMECVASGIPAVTSDFSGFGAYLQRNLPGYARNGIHVVPRRELEFSEAADNLADYLFTFLKQGLRDRIKLRNRVEAFSENFAWMNLVKHYQEAHELAVESLS